MMSKKKKFGQCDFLILKKDNFLQLKNAQLMKVPVVGGKTQ